MARRAWREARGAGLDDHPLAVELSAIFRRYLEAVLANVTKLRDQEAERMGAMHQASSLEEVRAIMSGHTYAKK